MKTTRAPQESDTHSAPAGRQRARVLRRLRPFIQAGFFVGLFFAVALAWPLEAGRPWATFLFRLDPLAAVVAMIAGRVFLWSMAWAGLTLLLTLAVGRAWCGWMCPLGTLLDAFPLASARRRASTSVPSSLRKVKYVLLALLLVIAVLGSQALMIFDPISIISQNFGRVFLPLIGTFFSAVEELLYPIAFTRPALQWLNNLLRGTVFPMGPRFYSGALTTALFLALLVSLNLLAPRFWCRYLCPLGGLLGLLSRTAIVRRQVLPACTACGKCARACPTGTISPEAGYASDPAECTLCLECQTVCPVSAIAFRPGGALKPAPRQPYDLSRRQTLTALGAGILAVGAWRLLPSAQETNPHRILPPGGRENNLASKCVRCGMCIRICPTGGLQPAAAATPDEFWSPLLVPRWGYCDYSCTACGEICPTHAIPRLPLDIKRTVIIGKAYIDTDRCIAWSDHTDCIVCEEMCPIPKKAIQLVETAVTTASGEPAVVKLPYVERERCIGCGICEYQCPVAGEAAIRVYTPL